MRSYFRKIAIAIAMVLGMTASMVIAADPAFAGSSYAIAGNGIYWCTDTSSTCTTSFDNFNTGAGLSMICWRDDRWTGGYNGTNNRWFYVNFDDGREGFINSSFVGNQTSVSNCSTNRSVAASLWALGKNGQSLYYNQCLLYVADAYTSVGYNIGGPSGSTVTAQQWWDAHYSQQVRGNTNPPRGALVFWTARPGYPDGHVAYALGNGWVISSYERGTTTIHMFRIGDRNNAIGYYGGWIIP